jgi:hypothetical protein
VTLLEFDRVLGKRVFDPAGRRVGRLEEAAAVYEGRRIVVPEFHIGTAALFERLAMNLIPLPLVVARGFIARWDQIDWSDPERLRLTCPVEELRRFTRRSTPRVREEKTRR